MMFRCYANNGFPLPSFFWIPPVRHSLSAGLQVEHQPKIITSVLEIGFGPKPWFPRLVISGTGILTSTIINLTHVVIIDIKIISPLIKSGDHHTHHHH